MEFASLFDNKIMAKIGSIEAPLHEPQDDAASFLWNSCSMCCTFDSV